MFRLLLQVLVIGSIVDSALSVECCICDGTDDKTMFNCATDCGIEYNCDSKGGSGPTVCVTTRIDNNTDTYFIRNCAFYGVDDCFNGCVSDPFATDYQECYDCCTGDLCNGPSNDPSTHACDSTGGDDGPTDDDDDPTGGGEQPTNGDTSTGGDDGGGCNAASALGAYWPLMALLIAIF